MEQPVPHRPALTTNGGKASGGEANGGQDGPAGAPTGSAPAAAAQAAGQRPGASASAAPSPQGEQAGEQVRAGVYRASRPGQAGPGAIGIRAPGLPALPDAMAIRQALRPMLRRITAGRHPVLDEDETVRRIAEERIWFPAFVPSRTRWTELALVVDCGATMDVWRSTLAELQRLLEAHGAFGDVRGWRLEYGPAGEPRLRASLRQRGAAETRRVNELNDASGRRVILLATDALGSAWRDGRMHAVLEAWGRHPMALLQMLPPRAWPRTPVGLPNMHLGAGQAGLPNTQLTVLAGVRRATPVPVMTLDPDAIGRWASVMAGRGGASIPAVSLDRFLPPATALGPGPGPTPGLAWAEAGAAEPEPPPAARERLRRFSVGASAPARRLAELFATVPLNLPIMRLVQQLMLPSSRHVHLAEVLAGGLLAPVTPRGPTDDPDEIDYEFVDPAIRDLLLEGQTGGEVADIADRVMAALSAFIGQHQGRPHSFGAALRDESGTAPLRLPPGARPFAVLGAEALARYGGEYAELAQRLRAGWEQDPDLTLRPRVTFGLARDPDEAEALGHPAWAPDGTRLAASGRFGMVGIWTADGMHQRDVPGGLPAWSPDGRRLVTVSEGRLQLWDPATWEADEGDTAERDPSRAATPPSGTDPWFAEAGSLHPTPMTVLSWSLDGDWFATGADDGTITLWSVAEGPSGRSTLLPRSPTDGPGGSPAPIRALSWSGDWIAIGSGAPFVVIWDRARSVIAAHVPVGAPAYSLAWSADGDLLFAGDATGAISVWRLERMVSADAPDPPPPPAPVVTLAGHTAPVIALSLDASQRLLASEAMDGTVRLWRMDQWRGVGLIPAPVREPALPAIAFHPRLAQLLTRADADAGLRLWDASLQPAIRRRPDGVLHVQMLMWEFPPLVVGGVWTACYHLIRALAGQDVRITVIVPWADGTLLPDPFGLPVEVVPLGIEPPGMADGRGPGAAGSAYSQPPPAWAPTTPGEVWTSYVSPSAAATAWSGYGEYPTAWSAYGGQSTAWSAYGGQSTAWSSYGGAPPAWARRGAHPVWSSYGGAPAAWSSYGGAPAAWSGYGGAGSAYGRPWSAYPEQAEPALSASVLFEVIGLFRQRVADYVAQHPADVIHAHDWVTFDAARAAATRIDVPWIAHFHSAEADRRPDGGDPLIERIEQGAVNTASRIVTPSVVTQGVIASAYNAAAERIAVVPNAFSDETTPADMMGRFETQRVVFIGRLALQKGVDRFCDVADLVLRTHPAARFEVFGDGERRGTLRGRSVVWRGAIGWNERGHAYAGASVVVVPSRAEPFGMVILEAMRHGVPVIYPDQSGAAEFLSTGIKVHTDSVEEIAAAVRRLLADRSAWTEIAGTQSAEIAEYGHRYGAASWLSLWRETIGAESGTTIPSAGAA